MNRTRMLEWPLLAAGLYLVCIVLRHYEIEPQVQVVLWKLGNVTVASYVGYWIDRHLYQDRITRNSPAILHIRRAVIVAACILAVAMGL